MSIYCFNSFDDTNFEETDIKNSKFDYCRLINCKFNNVSFENTTFNGCVLDSDLTGLNLRGSQYIPVEIILQQVDKLFLLNLDLMLI